MKVLLNVDRVGYTSKPKNDAAVISNRTRQQSAQKEIEAAELITYIKGGYTFTPAAIGGNIDEWKPRNAQGKREKKINPKTGRFYAVSDFWQSQQVICADIDNEKTVYLTDENGVYLLDDKGQKIPKKDNGGHVVKEPITYELTPGAALDACKAAGIDPFCIYKTFSYTPEHEKYRVLIILDKPITEMSRAADLIGRFAYLFDAAIAETYKTLDETPESCADASIEPVKLIFGGAPDCIYYRSEQITPIELLEALPKPPENGPITPSKEKTADYKPKVNREQIGANMSLAALEYQLEQDINNFDLAGYIEATTTSQLQQNGKYNPCPICGHNDCLSVNGPIYKCFSDNHPEIYNAKTKRYVKGGRIIDYLMQLHNITAHDAFNMFKFEIMKYNPDEWKRAYKEAKAQEFKTALDESIENWSAQDNPAADFPPGFFEDPQEQEAAPAADPGIDPSAEDANNIKSLEANMPPAVKMEKPQPAPAPLMSAADYYNADLYDADIDELKQYAGRKIGLHPDIDKYLTLYPGLAIIGGQASLGKTTFCVNIAAQLLERGEHVLYFALEQTTADIMTKFAARYIYEQDNATETDNIKLKNGLRDPGTCEQLAQLSEKLQNLYIIKSDFEVTIAGITATISEYMKTSGVKPIVIIDYLQIIAPGADNHGSKTDYIDENLKALKKYQNETGLFILLISSFNRANNYEPVSYESFLYTSAIEFTCDYVFGLQLQILDYDNEEFYIKKGKQGGEYTQMSFEKKKQVQEAQSQNPKKVQFVSLKNRNGRQLFKANFDYYPAHDYFTPDYSQAWNKHPYNTIFDKIKGAQ